MSAEDAAALGLYLPYDPAGNADALWTPQRNENPRRPTRLFRRDALDVYRAEHAQAAATLHGRITGVGLRRTGPAPTPEALRLKLAEHLGWNYCFSHRCDGTTHCHDCSGYQCWGMDSIGAGIGCNSSFVMAQMCTDRGLEVTYDDFMDGMVGWAFRGLDHGRRSGGAVNGSDGHIVFVDMKRIGGTYEAMGHAYGVRVGAFNRTRQFTGFYKIIGLDYSTPSSDTKAERMLFIDTVHPAPHPSRTRSASIQADGTILLGNAGRIAGASGPIKPTQFQGLRIVKPNSGGALFLGAAPRPGVNGFKLQFLQADSSFADFDYEFIA